MRLEQLEYMVELSKQKSFNIASEKLHITQQSLSQSIKTLENEIEVKLFLRSSHGISLTTQGEIFLTFAQETLNNYRNTLHRIQNDPTSAADQTLEGTLNIYSNSIFYLSFLPETSTLFHKQYPRIKTVLKTLNTPSILRLLKTVANTADNQHIGLVSLPINDKGILPDYLPGENFAFQPIRKGRYRFYVSRTSNLASQKQISLKSALKCPLIIHAIGDNAEETPLCSLTQSYGYTRFEAKQVTDSISLWIDSIDANLGAGFLHEAASIPESPYFDKLNNLAALNIKEYFGSLLGCMIPPNYNLITEAFLDCLPSCKDALCY